MTVTLRLDDALLAQVDRAAQAKGLTRSELIRAAIRDYCARNPDGQLTAYEKMKDLIGSVSGGPPDLASNVRKYVLQQLTERASRRSR